MPTRGARALLSVGLLAIAYYAAARAGLALAVINESASPVWPPTGLAVGALAAWGLRLWPGVALGALAANWQTTHDPASSLVIALGNAAEALLGGWALRRYCGGPDAFDHAAGAGRFLFWGAVVAPLPSSLVGATALAAFGHASWSSWGPVWATWYAGDAMGALIVAPAVMLLPRAREVDLRRVPVVEGSAFVAALLVLAAFVFGPWRPDSLADVRLGVIALPLVAWAAMRFGPLVSSWTVLASAGMALGGVVAGRIPLGLPDENLALLQFQGLLGILSLSGLITAAVARERTDAYADLARAHDQLERLVGERTARLREAMADLHEAQEMAAMGRWHLNERGLLSGSPWLHRTFDVATAAPPRAWTRRLPAEEGERFVQRFYDAMDAGEPFAFVEALHFGDDVRYLQFVGAPMPDGRGWHGSCQDVTRSREAAAAAMRLAAIVDSSPYGIVSATLDGRIESWNRGAADLLGYTPEEAVGMDLFRLVPESDRRPMQALREEVLERGDAAEVRAERIHKDGHLVPVGVTLSAVHDPAGPRITAVLRDLRPELDAQRLADDARRIEQELKVLDELTRLKTEFINMASHELRTPLTPIRVQLHLLKTSALDEAGQRRALEVIDRNMIRLSDLVEDVFAAARLQAGGFAINASDTDFASLAHDAATAFGGQADQHGVRIDVRHDGDARLRADPDRLTQVLFNLLGNALKYTPPDSTVHVEVHGGKEHVRVAVEDEGPGIPDDMKERLFKPFSRRDQDTRPGTGLGLYICKGIAELHGGTIRLAKSHHQHGARFEVVFPKQPTLVEEAGEMSWET